MNHDKPEDATNTALSEIERLKVLRTMRVAYPLDSEFNELIRTHFPAARDSTEELEEIRRRVQGLILEDEFSILCRLMGHCHTVTALEQTPMKDRALLAPDFLVNFNLDWDKTGCLPNQTPFMVEVKTQDAGKPKALLTESHFIKRKNYADQFGIPLLMATRFYCVNGQRFWVIQTEEQFLACGRKPSIDNWWEQSVSHLLLGDWLIVNESDTLIEFKVSGSIRRPVSGSPITIDQIESITITCLERSFTLDDTNRALFLFLDCFPQHLVKDNEQAEKRTYQHVIKKGAAVPLSDLILRANESALENSGLVFTSPSRLLALQDNNPSYVIDKSWALKSLQFFNDNVTHFNLTPSPNLNELKEALVRATQREKL